MTTATSLPSAVPPSTARAQAFRDKAANTFVSLNQRLVAMLKAGHAPTVNALLTCGSSPYETLTVEASSPGTAPDSFSLLGWALSTGLDDERGTPALERLLAAALDLIRNRRTANQAVSRWVQDEWRTGLLLKNDRQGVLRWALMAQQRVLHRALPWADEGLLLEHGLGATYTAGTIDPQALTHAVHAKAMTDLLTLPSNATLARSVRCATAVLGAEAWGLTVNDPVPGVQRWPALPVPWMAGVLQRWAILTPWLAAQPDRVWVAPPPAVQPPVGAERSGFNAAPDRHLLDLVMRSLSESSPAWFDQANHVPLANLAQAMLDRAEQNPAGALHHAWSDAALADLARRVRGWSNPGTTVNVPGDVQQRLITSLERRLLHGAANRCAPVRARARL